MAKTIKEEALLYHSQGKPGKIEVVPTKPYSTQKDLSLAYSPGVAEPCLEIEKNPQLAYEYTTKGNLVAVISNGTAVLGLGDIGALAGKPVMEGKGLLFKIYAGVDVFDIEVDEKDPEKFIQTVKAISPTFGGINLEDIKAPECFEIERRLKEELDIPVMHDDQHGTAIISAAALLNALDITHKNITKIKLVVNGAGASAVACTKLYMKFGVQKENIIMCDSKGVLTTKRPDLSESKKQFAIDSDITTFINAKLGSYFEPKEIPFALESGSFFYEEREYYFDEDFKDEMASLVNNFDRALNEHFKVANYKNIYIVGGGATFWGQYLKKSYPRIQVEEDSQMINAECFKLLGEMRLKSKV